MPALEIYRRHFKPSEQLDKPYAMVAANIIAADTDAEARRLFTSLQQSFVKLRRGTPGKLAPPLDGDISSWAAPMELAGLNHSLVYSFVGSPQTVSRGVQSFSRDDPGGRAHCQWSYFRPGGAPAFLRAWPPGSGIR